MVLFSSLYLLTGPLMLQEGRRDGVERGRTAQRGRGRAASAARGTGETRTAIRNGGPWNISTLIYVTFGQEKK